jgi:phosphonate transport system ATP-binding protein
MFAERIVGLQLGEIVYDGPPGGLTPDVLTQIYGEEDWEATVSVVEDDDEDEDLADAEVSTGKDDNQTPAIDRDRLAGLT